MKVLILAGGLGSRLSEETVLKPKPMVEIGGKPILWHIMKIYSYYGYNDFIILCGYKGYMIKEYFANYYRHMSDLTIDMATNTETYHYNKAEPWRITLVDTGQDTLTGGRIKRVAKYIDNTPFMLTYGDGVADIDIHQLVNFHNLHSGAITLSAYQAEGKWGSLKINADQKVMSFEEKPKNGNWINAGFFVCQPEVLEYIEGDHTIFEREPLERAAIEDQLFTYKHYGFWKPMDTLRDKNQLEQLILRNQAPWIKWGKNMPRQRPITTY